MLYYSMAQSCRRLGKLRRFGSSWLVKLVLALIALSLVIFILGRHHTRRKISTNSLDSCLECSCDCLADLPSISMPVDIFNNSFLESSLSVYTNCGKDDPDMNKEMEKDISSLMSEEINLLKNATRDNLERTKTSLLEVKTISSHYQKEAEKCLACTVSCEEARERAEASLVVERKISEQWEQTAHEWGWNEEESS